MFDLRSVQERDWGNGAARRGDTDIRTLQVGAVMFETKTNAPELGCKFVPEEVIKSRFVRLGFMGTPGGSRNRQTNKMFHQNDKSHTKTSSDAGRYETSSRG